MPRSITSVATALGILLGMGGRSAIAAKPRIAVIGIELSKAEGDLKEKFEAAVAGGLAASGADVVDSTETRRLLATRGMAGCTTSTCLIAIGQASGAADLVRGSVEILGRSYTIRLEMLDGSTGSLIEMREDRCDICTEDEAYETAGVTASALKAKVFKRRAQQSAAAPPPPAAPAPQATVALPPSPAPEPPPRWPRTLSWVSIGVGVLAVAAGAFLISIHHDETCSAGGRFCLERWNTELGGIALTTLGAAAVMTGGVMLLTGRY